MNPTYTMFALYLLVMVFIGIVCMKKSSSKLSDYLLGGRGVGAWVTAMSAQASDMSGWLLMGLPGAIYMLQGNSGWGDIWCAVGLALGTFANWLFVAPRLRIYSERTKSLTVSAYFSERFNDRKGVLRVIAALLTLVFFTVYAGSGLVAAGKLFESLLGMSYKSAVILGCIVILAYVFMGGYLAVCWTDLVQGLLMFFAVIIVPIAAIVNNPNVNFSAAIAAKNITCFPGGVSVAGLIGILSAAAWGLGYFGQPHILTRFMSVKSFRQIPRATTIAMLWVVISLSAAVMIAFVGIGIWNGPAAITSGKEAEKIFIFMVQRFCNPWLGGVLLAAILAAIMSTIDSQLLAVSSTLTADVYKLFVRRNASDKELVWASRFFVLAVTVVALFFALADLETIFVIVKFAWGGFGAAFGPVILISLYSRKMSFISALGSMIVGTAVSLIWYFTGMGKVIYELLPGFLAGCIAAWILTAIFPEKDPKVLEEFDAMKDELLNEKDSDIRDQALTARELAIAAREEAVAIREKAVERREKALQLDNK